MFFDFSTSMIMLGDCIINLSLLNLPGLDEDDELLFHISYIIKIIA